VNTVAKATGIEDDCDPNVEIAMRIRSLMLLGSVLLLATPATAACNHSASAPWASAKKLGLVLSAYSVGEKCGTTALVLTVSDSKGTTIWSTTRLAQHVLIFADADMNTDKAVKAKLAEWIAIGQESKVRTTSNLPDWPAGAEGPTREGDGEFGYSVEEGTARDSYLDDRKKGYPLFCFVQGFESEACIIATSPNSISEFGGTSFPG
jgi:hypothetical protein